MSYQIVAISNEKRAPEQAYNKLERAAACPDANYAGKILLSAFSSVLVSFIQELDQILMWRSHAMGDITKNALRTGEEGLCWAIAA